MKKVSIIFLSLLSCFVSAVDYRQAHLSYQKGEEAQTIAQRELHFNAALDLYTQEVAHDGRLYYNIANCYYQLGELGMAIWYYHKALRLLPRDGKINDNLSQATFAAKIAPSSWDGVKRLLLFPKYLLSSSERTTIFLVISLLLFIMGSICIWLPRKLFYVAFIFLATAGGIFSFSSVMGNSLKEAVMVRPALLRCDAGEQYKEVSEDLIREGELCTIIEVGSNQSWVKIKRGALKGFVRADHIRPI